MRELFGNNIFFQLYILLGLIYKYVNHSVYKSILVPLETVFFILGMISFLYTILLHNKKLNIFLRVNTILILVVLIGIAAMKPSYTYKSAMEKLKIEVPSETFVEINMGDYMETRQCMVLKAERDNPLIRGEYLFHTADGSSYIFDSSSGEYLSREK